MAPGFAPPSPAIYTICPLFPLFIKIFRLLRCSRGSRSVARAFTLQFWPFSCLPFRIRPPESIKVRSLVDFSENGSARGSEDCVLMKVEARFGEEEEEEEEAKRAVGKRNGERLLRKRECSRRTRRRVQPTSTVIQRLFLACKTVFRGGPGTVPELADVEMLQLLLDKMIPEDVGLSTDTLLKVKGSSKGTPRITYAVIYKCDNFSICIFILPPRAVIPLHNHPGMTVFSKLLLGSMHIKSYDWLDPVTSINPTPSVKLRGAKLVVDSDFVAPCDTSILYPSTGGNIHMLTANTTCALLDVQGPPYSKEEGRDITHYRDHPFWKYPNGATDDSEGKDCSLGWLEEVDVTGELKMDGVQYLGPQIIDV